MKVISILNHKGGVGKTTTAATVGSCLSKKGYNVLLIDMDGQANLTTSLGVKIDPQNNIYTALILGRYEIISIKENLSIIPSSLDLSAAEMEMSQEPGRELLLRSLIEEIEGKFDFVIIDCPPSLGLLSINALTASDYLLIPITAEPLALYGMQKLLGITNKVMRRLNKSLSILGIVITRYDSRSNLYKEVRETISEQFEKLAFNTVINQNVKVSEANSQQIDLIEYAPECKAARDYSALTEEIIKKI